MPLKYCKVRAGYKLLGKLEFNSRIMYFLITLKMKQKLFNLILLLYCLTENKSIFYRILSVNMAGESTGIEHSLTRSQCSRDIAYLSVK